MSPTCLSTAVLAASALAATGRNMLHGVIIGTDGTNAATVTVYDNTSAAGKKVFEAVVEGTSRSRDFMFSRPVRSELGLYVAISGTGATAQAYYG